MSDGATWQTGGGRGKFHLVEDGSGTTVCGRPVPEDARTTPYSSANCRRCETQAPDLAEQAEEARKALAGKVTDAQQQRLDWNRAGNFLVCRCKVCGGQHTGKNPNVPGVPACMGPEGFHEADLESVEVQGPKWEPTPHPKRGAGR